MKDDIKKLEQDILRHKNLYYRGKAEISDIEFDQLEEKLRKVAPTSYVLEMVGSEVFGTGKVEHSQKMLSLNKTYKVDDLLKWKADNELVGTFKIDGSSCSLIYSKSILQMAKTRGDGKFGENITNKIMYIENIPKKIETYTGEIEIRGEVYCTEENFLLLSDYMESLGLERPSSLRNIVAGILGRKDNVELAKYLSFQAFELFEVESNLESEMSKFALLNNLGFLTPEYRLIKERAELEKFLKDAESFIAEGNYLIDGLVFSFNALELHRTMGETAHHPKYKMAFKFQGDTKVSSIESISWQVSRNGILTPVANIVPVELSGAKVSRVTLHNFGVVRAHQLKAGDKIKIVRSGEVIPKFLELVEDSKLEFNYPTLCPSCSAEVQEVEIRLICNNEKCPAQVKDSILNFIQKIGIDDLSGKRLEILIEKELVKSIFDLYKLKVEDLLELEKIKDKLANKIIDNIEKSKDVNLITFLSALGITGGAYNKCERVVDAGLNTIEKVMNLSVEKLQNIEGFAEKSSTDFVDSLQSKADLVDKLLAVGFSFRVKSKKESAISGKKICVTGSLSMKRADLQKMIKDNSGLVVSSVSKATDYLVTNDTKSSSSKFKKAQELNIPIVSEKDLMEMING